MNYLLKNKHMLYQYEEAMTELADLLVGQLQKKKHCREIKLLYSSTHSK